MTRIVAIGDSTTAGTPLFLSPLEAPPDGRGDETSQYSYWLMKAHPQWEVLNRGVNGEPGDRIRARFEINEWILAGTDLPRGNAPDAVVDARVAVAAPGNPDRLSDSTDDLHPSAAGYRRMADAIRPVLENLLR